MRWHDGAEFTSSDVAFSIALLKAHHPRGRATFANVVEVQTPEPHTAVIVLSEPAPFLLCAFSACESPIVPRLSMRVPTRPRTAMVLLQSAPALSSLRSSHVVFERNPTYWDDPKPYLDGLVVKIHQGSGRENYSHRNRRRPTCAGHPGAIGRIGSPTIQFRSCVRNPRIQLHQPSGSI